MGHVMSKVQGGHVMSHVTSSHGHVPASQDHVEISEFGLLGYSFAFGPTLLRLGSWCFGALRASLATVGALSWLHLQAEPDLGLRPPPLALLHRRRRLIPTDQLLAGLLHPPSYLRLYHRRLSR